MADLGALHAEEGCTVGVDRHRVDAGYHPVFDPDVGKITAGRPALQHHPGGVQDDEGRFDEARDIGKLLVD